MNVEILTGLTGLLSTVIGSTISWVLARKKYNSEVDSTVIANMQQSLNFYKELSDDNKARLQDLQDKNKALESEVASLREQVFQMMQALLKKEVSTNKKLKSKKKWIKKESGG